jgi:hypothetical protein
MRQRIYGLLRGEARRQFRWLRLQQLAEEMRFQPVGTPQF